MSGPLDERRLRRLVEVGGYLTAELGVEAVLERVLEASREITGARFAALGVLDQHKRELERFITKGIDPETHARIGDLPRGRGVLGVLIEDPRPLRLHEVSSHPRSYGFPANHPPMNSFLGVPVLVRGEAWGNLYLTEKEGGDFDEADEAAVLVLAEWAAVAVENARLYEQAETRRLELERAVRGLETTVAIARALGGETDISRVLELIVKRARALVDAGALAILLREGPDLVVAATAGEAGAGVVGKRIPATGTVTEHVVRTRRAEQVDDVASRMGAVAAALGVTAQTALIAPLSFRGQVLGALQAYDRATEGPGFSDEDAALLEAFAASAATAVATAQSVERERLRRSIEAAEQERRRWARELHDETLQSLAALRLKLSAASRGDPEQLREVARSTSDELAREIEELRHLIAELRPAALDELGLEPALESLVERTTADSDMRADLRVHLEDRRLSPEIESTAYRLVQEALANVVRHAQADEVRIRVEQRNGELCVDVTDDGRGFDPEAPAHGFGVMGMRERADLVSGRLHVRSKPGHGTAVEASLPLRPATSAPPPAQRPKSG